MRCNKNLIFLFVILITINNTYSQNSFNAGSIINSYMEFVRENNYAPAIDTSLLRQENSQEIFNGLQKYYLDTLPKVRLKAYYITYKLGVSYNSDSRIYAINKLVSGCKDDDAGIVGSCFSWLSTFNKNDFDKNAIDSISVLLDEETAHYDKLLKIVGFLDLKEKTGLIRNMLANNRIRSEKNRWAGHLALARLGEQDEINYILNKVEKLQLSDNVVYNVFPDIIYTRQKSLFEYIIDVLQSNEENCFSANPESTEKIICGYRVMEYLAPVIENYPIEIDKWGDIIAEDYPEALQLVRKWFLEINNNYKIKSDTF